MSEILIVDGNAFAVRAYYNGSGIINGFLNYLSSLGIPEYLVIAFDYGGKGWRHDLYPNYKANRPPKPDDLVSGIKQLKSSLVRAGVCVLEAPMLEGDDIIASVAAKVSKAGFKVRVATCDHDFFQIVNSNVHLNLIGRNGFTYVDVAGVRSIYGMSPNQVIDYKALIGDTADGYKGVMGIGEKAGKELLAEFGNLDTIYGSLDRIKPAVAKKLEAGRADAFVCRQLATMMTGIKIKVDRAMCLVTDDLQERLFSI